MTTGDMVYKVRGKNPAGWIGEINRIFELLADRLDKIEGYRGVPKFWNYVETENDIVVLDSTRGVVWKDTNSPPLYWRLSVDNSGALTLTNLGPVYP